MAISGLLQYHLGKAQRDLIFSDVSFPEENDTRDVFLSPTEIERLLLCCEEAGRVLARTQGRDAYIPPVIFPAMVRLALVTGADRGALRRAFDLLLK